MLKYRLKWETLCEIGFELPIGGHLRLDGNTTRLVHVRGDLYTDVDTTTLLKNTLLNYKPQKNKTRFVGGRNPLGLRPKVSITAITNTYSHSLFPPVKVAECSLIIGE